MGSWTAVACWLCRPLGAVLPVHCSARPRSFATVGPAAHVSSEEGPSRRTARTRHVELLNPRSIKPSDLADGEWELFQKCRSAIFHNDYAMIAPMLREVQRHSVVVLTGLVEALGKMGRIEEMENALNCWLAAGSRPSLALLEVIMEKLVLRGLIEKAKHWENLLTERYRVRAGIGVRNYWFTYYLNVNNLAKAKEAFDQLRRDKIAPNRITYTLFYKYFGAKNDFVAAEQAKAAMLAAGLVPNVSFYNMQLSLFFPRGMLKEVDAVIDEMKQRKVWMETSTLDILVTGYAMNGRRDELEKWLWERGKESGAGMSQRSYSRLIEALGMNMSDEQCRDIFADMGCDASGSSLNVFVYYALAFAFLEQRRFDEVVELLNEMQRMEMAMPETFYVRFGRKCVAARFYYGITFIRDEMKRHNICRGHAYYTFMVHYYLKKQDYQSVDELLREMYAGGVYMNEATLIAIIDHFCTTAHYKKIGELLEFLSDPTQKHYLGLSDRVHEHIQQSIYIYACQNLGGILKRSIRVVDRASDGPFDTPSDVYIAPDLKAIKGRLGEAFPSLPFHPSVHIFNDMLVYCLKSARFEDSAAVFAEMRRQAITPNIFTFTYLIKSRLWLGQPEEAKKLLYEMRRYGHRPSQFHFGLVHHAFCRLGMTADAETLLKDMSQVFHVLPNHVFYAALLFAHCRRFEYTAVFRTFESMEKSGLKADTETSNYVLLSLFDVGEYAEAMQFFSKMCLGGVRRNTYTYTILADRMLARDDMEGILGILEDAFLPGNTIDDFPFVRILSYLHNKLSHDFMEQVVDLMVRLGVKVDTATIPFVLFVFYRKMARIELLPDGVHNKDEASARILLEKALIDMSDGSDGELIVGTPGKISKVPEVSAIWEAHDRLAAFYQKHRDLFGERLDSLTVFVEHLEGLGTLFLKSKPGKRAVEKRDISTVFDHPSIADLLSATRIVSPLLDKLF